MSIKTFVCIKKENPESYWGVGGGGFHSVATALNLWKTRQWDRWEDQATINEIDTLTSKSLIIIYVFDQRYVVLEDINIVFLQK